MPQFTVPRRFAEDLRRYDTALRCRWSDALDTYVIERKVSRAKTIEPKLLADDEVVQSLTAALEQEEDVAAAVEIDARLRFMAEEYQAAVDGYVILFEVERDALDSRVFYTLFDSDIWRQGGAEVVNARIDRAYDWAVKVNRAQWMDEVRARAKDWWRYAHTVRTVPETRVHTAPAFGLSINR